MKCLLVVLLEGCLWQNDCVHNLENAQTWSEFLKSEGVRPVQNMLRVHVCSLMAPLDIILDGTFGMFLFFLLEQQNVDHCPSTGMIALTI